MAGSCNNLSVSIKSPVVDGNANSASKAFTCSVCCEYYKTPKVLPGCGHSLCYDCVFKTIKFSSLTCPECQIVSQIAEPSGLQTNLALQRAVETFKSIDEKAELETSLPTVLERSVITSSNDVCHHLLTCKSPLSCPHCGVKFCRSCQTGHKERIKVEVISLANNLEQRREDSLKTLDETFDSIRGYIEGEVIQTERGVVSAFQEIEAALKNALASRRDSVIGAVRTCGEVQLQNVQKIVANVQQAKRPDRMGAKLVEQSSLSMTLDELATMHEAASLIDKEIKALEGIKESIFDRKLHFEDDSDLKNALFQHINSPIPSDHVQWIEKDELERIDVQEAVSKVHQAAKTGDLNLLKEIVLKPPPDWSRTAFNFLIIHKDESDLKRTPLLQAAYHGHAEITKFLLEDLPFAVEQNVIGAAFVAAALGSLPVLQVLVKHQPSLLDEKDVHDAFLIHRAAGGGHVETVKWLLREKSSLLDQKGQFGRTPLLYAVELGHIDAVSFLLERGANAFSKDNAGKMSIHLATIFDQLAILKLLLNKKPNLISAKDEDGSTALVFAKGKNLKEIVAFLQDRSSYSNSSHHSNNNNNNNNGNSSTTSSSSHSSRHKSRRDSHSSHNS